MSAFVPDQLDQMSKTGLLEFARTAQEENVKLVKRVNELESYNVGLANESHEYQQRCVELQETIYLLEKDLLRQSVFMINTAAKLEPYQKWKATANVLRRPTRETKQALKKFALEQKIEALESVREYVTSEYPKAFMHNLNKRIEQLRKGQEND